MPHRAPGAPGPSAGNYLSGKVITYYRPRGSEDIRQLIELRSSDSPMAGRRATEILRTRLEVIEARMATFGAHRERLVKALHQAGERPDNHLQFLELSIDDDRSVKEA